MALTRGVVQRFPHLLTAPGEAKSPRDQAAHRAPVEPVFLFVLFHEGRVAIELHDVDTDQLGPIRTREMDSMMLGHESRLTKVLDTQLADLVDFCAELLDLAARAEAHRIANG